MSREASTRIRKPTQPLDLSASAAYRRLRCNQCEACLREDCGVCVECRHKKKFGGSGKSKQPCIHRRCIQLYGTSGKRARRRGSNETPLASAAASVASSFDIPKNLDIKLPSTSYLQLDDKEAEAESPKTSSIPVTTLYGQPVVPRTIVQDVCAGCNQDVLTKPNDPVLLCDGCDGEYHLSCCRPSLTSIPKGSWFCWSCCPHGSTSILQEALQESDERRCDYNNSSSSDYIAALLQQDMHAHHCTRRPLSELLRALELKKHGLAQRSRTRSGPRSAETHDPSLFLGQPIRLLVDEKYYTGRIVDWRYYQKKASSTIEYLVRFTSGFEDRKSSYEHWIVLEEHVLLVGMTVLWAKVNDDRDAWKPAQLHVRTSRELVLVHKALRESEGQILYEDSEESSEDDAPPTKSPSKRKRSAWGLCKFFGTNEYRLVDLKDEAVDFFNPEAMHKYTTTEECKYLVAMAQAEWNEQEAVRTWQKLKQKNPVGPMALSSRDEYALEPLVPANTTTQPQVVPQLCPLVPQGLDRLYVTQLLEQRGMLEPASKDMASSISCKVVPVNVANYYQEKSLEERQQNALQTMAGNATVDSPSRATPTWDSPQKTHYDI